MAFRIGVGEVVAAGSAILLLVFTFFRWYGLGDQETNLLSWFVPFEYGGNAWQTLDYLPLILLLAITVPVGVALLRLSGLGWWSPTPPGALTCGGGVLAALAILARIVFPPELVDDFRTVLESGIFLALTAACGSPPAAFWACAKKSGRSPAYWLGRMNIADSITEALSQMKR